MSVLLEKAFLILSISIDPGLEIIQEKIKLFSLTQPLSLKTSSPHQNGFHHGGGCVCNTEVIVNVSLSLPIVS